MHEMTLCASLLRIIEDQAVQHGFERVHGVHLQVGAFAGVEVEALRFSFDVVARGTLADTARLVVIESGVEAWCLDCEAAVATGASLEACPRCGGARLRLDGGTELRLLDLEVQLDSEPGRGTRITCSLAHEDE